MMDNGILYDHIGTGYNSTRQADSLITQKLLELLSPRKEETYIDIGCGTGNYTIALAKEGFNFYGVEPSEEMLNIARQKSIVINWLNGIAEEIPLENNTFNGAIATLTIHHWKDMSVAFREISRVLIPGSSFIIFTALPAQMENYWLNHYFPMMMADSITQMPGMQEIETAANASGFSVSGTEKYFITANLQDNFLYAGKHKPEIYFDENIRRGISSFMALANFKEVQQGLLKLKDNLASGDFLAVKERYNNHTGDYLFINLNKES